MEKLSADETAVDVQSGEGDGAGGTHIEVEQGAIDRVQIGASRDGRLRRLIILSGGSIVSMDLLDLLAVYSALHTPNKLNRIDTEHSTVYRGH